MNRIRVRDITGLDTLAGKSGGLRDFPKFMAAIEDTPEGSNVVLDWSGVEIATASYFGATLVPIIRMTMAGDLDRYLIAGGLNKTCLDELKLVLDLQGLVALIEHRNKNGGRKGIEVLGNLDSAYVEALAAVQGAKGASASELHQRQGLLLRRGIGKTGWINRLSTLHRLRLVRKQRMGREFVFHAVN